MKSNRLFCALRILVMTIPLITVVSCFGANLPEEITESDRFGASFRNGDTNAPLLALDWFSGPRSIEFCQVSQSGKVWSARNVISRAIQGGHQTQLDQTNLESLTMAMKALPPPVSQSLPKERLLVVRGFCANQSFEFTYDRANVPKAVEKLYEITGAYLEWFIPKIDGHLIAHTSYGGYSGSQSAIESFCIASAAPTAVSSGVNGIQIWDLKNETATPLLFLKKMPKVDFEHPWNPAAISPDGNIIAYASEYATFAVNWKAERILWETNPLVDPASGGCLTKKIAIGGDKGQFLFVATAHKVERWDLLTGKRLATLDTNHLTIQFLETSRDGKILVAGFNDNNPLVGGCITAPTSISVWKSDEDAPSSHIETQNFTGIGISPDGRRIALSIFGQKNLLLWNWQKGMTNEIPFRTPYASFHADAMFWSPDKTRFAAYVDTYPASIVIYDALNWKPLAHWKCGQAMSDAKFDFANDGEFVELRDHDLTGLDMKLLVESEN
ncbi:MAG: WD40 repeat domain-containing protein [Verrucomicrobiia bacterium]